MLKKHLTLLLTALLLPHVFAAPAFAAPQGETQDQRTAQVKASVARRGTGKRSRVTVKLRDGTKLKGYISQAGEDSFAITDEKAGQASTVAYHDVVQIKGRGGLSTASKIGIGVAIGVAVFIVGLRAGGPILR